MNIFIKRHQSSLSKESQIRHLCKSGSLSHAFRVLNSLSPLEIAVKSTLYASLLQTCVKVVAFESGRQIHAHVIKSGLSADRFVGNTLLALYFKLGSLISETRRVFDDLHVKDVISWTSMVSGYVKVGKPLNGIELFREMTGSGIDPNGFTLSSVIKACSDLQYPTLGRGLHAVVMKRGFDTENVIASSLIDMYGKNHNTKDAHQMFDELAEPDTVCWTSVVSAMTKNDSFETALILFRSMNQDVGFSGDEFTFGSVLTACGNLRRLRQGKQVHARAVSLGLIGNVVVESSLVDMYGKCGSTHEARWIFDSMATKNSVSWSALLGAYTQNGLFESAIGVFREAEKHDLHDFGTVLRCCSGLSATRLGKEIHCRYVRSFDRSDVIVESALVDLYAKSGYVDSAYRVFTRMPIRNLITWNSMICGFAHNGRGFEVLELLDQMIEKEDNIKPDYITFVGVLFACSHSGLVEQGKRYFESMKREFGVKPGLEHYNCMVDLLGRAGLVEEAEDLILTAECEEKSSLWTALLGACTSCSDSNVTERVAKRLMDLKPQCHLSYVLLGNVYRASGRWNDAMRIRTLMRDRGVSKKPGKSWIETNIVGSDSKETGFF